MNNKRCDDINFDHQAMINDTAKGIVDMHINEYDLNKDNDIQQHKHKVKHKEAELLFSIRNKRTRNKTVNKSLPIAKITTNSSLL